MTILALEDVYLSFGGINALSEVSFSINEGEFLSLIGPNGAGKTSVVNCISGFYQPNLGKILFNGENITFTPSYERTKKGVSRTFQNIETFQSMKVIDLIRLGAHVHLKASPFSNLLGTPSSRKEEKELLDFISDEILPILRLEDVASREVYSLPYGLQKRVDLGRALASRPNLLILDEPVAGMNKEESQEMIEVVMGFKEKWNLSILMVEHDMELVMRYSDRITVLNFGNPVATGTPIEIQQNEDVVAIYLGGE
ncbi:ABC transporter ATP-binding protein [Schinkia azotoformans]|uniref:ABC transporter ATP-binding protein n=1 Tax=Schinkia azotoformans TaxID=1454 RepID=UPI002E22EC4A|nr:ABC transporter ATP-binding protein [Schinkia azotoformans]